MFNDWHWEKIDDSEYRLKNQYDHVAAYLIHNYDDKWSCRFCNDDCNMKFVSTFEGFKNTEEVIWWATWWIYQTCAQIGDSFYRIRDHLPRIEFLRGE